MGWKAEYEQQKLVMRRVFWMFTTLALMLTAVAIRQRGWTYCLPVEYAADPSVRPNRPPSAPPIHLRAPSEMLLGAARLALALLDAMTRTAHELMNRTYMLAHWFVLSVWVYPPVDQCALPGKRLDSS